MIQRMSPEEFLARQEEEQKEEYRLINGEPVPPEPAPQIQYIPIRAAENTNTDKTLWGVLGILGIVGIIVVGIVALCKK